MGGADAKEGRGDEEVGDDKSSSDHGDYIQEGLDEEY
jgi:hypothetical protein